MKRDIRLAVLLLFVICMSLASLTAWQVWSARERTLAEANTHNLNLAKALDTYFQGIVTQSSMLLLGVGERLESEGSTPEHLERLRRLVDSQQLLLAQLDGLTIYDANGDWLMSSNGPIPAGANSADRAFFARHRDDPSRGVFIGPPIKSRATGDWVMTVSRRFDHPDGRFAGVIAVTLGIENFLRLFGQIDLGEHGAIGLTTSSGQLLVRYPFREEDMGKDLSKSVILTRYLAGAQSGTADFTSTFDGVGRIYAFHKNTEYPLVTTVALAKDEVLAAWRAEAARSAGVVLVAAREDLLQANQRLEVLASQDPLTGLANRRCFDDMLAVETRRAGREDTPLSLLLIDIDHFKRFNDRYGHIAGDECLKAVSQTLLQCLRRPGDLAVRYGGEELAVILPNTDSAGAVAVAEAFLQRLEQLDMTHGDSAFGRVTASLGVATLAGASAPGRELELVESADRALYRAKAAAPPTYWQVLKLVSAKGA